MLYMRFTYCVLTLLKLGELRLLAVIKCSGMSLSEKRLEGERYWSMMGSKLSLSCDGGDVRRWEREGEDERGRERGREGGKKSERS